MEELGEYGSPREISGNVMPLQSNLATGKDTPMATVYVVEALQRIYIRGETYIRSVGVKLDSECRSALDEWYIRTCTHGLVREFESCRGTHSVTGLGMWLDRKNRRKPTRREGAIREEGRMVRLNSPLGIKKGCPATMTALAG